MPRTSTAALSLGRVLGRQRYLPYGVRDRLLRLIWPPGPKLAYPFKVDFAGASFVGDLNNYIDWHVYFYGAYESPILEAIAIFLADSTPQCFWDVGANCGQHSVFAAAQGASVYAFEPWLPVFAKLKENAAANPELRIVPDAIGLSDEQALVSFHEPKNENFGGGSFGPGGSIELLVRRGDDLVREGTPPPTLLKIDVQGYEPKVLAGLQETIARFRPAIICEDTAIAGRLGIPNPADLVPGDYKKFEFSGHPEALRLRPLSEGRSDRDLLLAPEDKIPPLLAPYIGAGG